MRVYMTTQWFRKLFCFHGLGQRIFQRALNPAFVDQLAKEALKSENAGCELDADNNNAEGPEDLISDSSRERYAKSLGR